MDAEEITQQLAAFREQWRELAASSAELGQRIEEYAMRADESDPAIVNMQLHKANGRQLAMFGGQLMEMAEGLVALHQRVEALERRAP